jgi:hypothetical protein
MHTTNVYITSFLDGSWLMQENVKRKGYLYEFCRGRTYFPEQTIVWI